MQNIFASSSFLHSISSPHQIHSNRHWPQRVLQCSMHRLKRFDFAHYTYKKKNFTGQVLLCGEESVHAGYISNRWAISSTHNKRLYRRVATAFRFCNCHLSTIITPIIGFHCLIPLGRSIASANTVEPHLYREIFSPQMYHLCEVCWW